MNAKLNDLIAEEVGGDDGSFLPIATASGFSRQSLIGRHTRSPRIWMRMSDRVEKKRSPSFETAFSEGLAYIAGVSTGREMLDLAASIFQLRSITSDAVGEQTCSARSICAESRQKPTHALQQTAPCRSKTRERFPFLLSG